MDTQKHVCLSVFLLPSDHSASATAESLAEKVTWVWVPTQLHHICAVAFTQVLSPPEPPSLAQRSGGSQCPPWELCKTHGNSWRCLAHEKAQQCWVRSDSEVRFQKGIWPVPTQGFITSLSAFFSAFCLACEIFNSLTRGWTQATAMKMPCPTHWTTRTVPLCLSLRWWHWERWPSLSSSAVVKSCS